MKSILRTVNGNGTKYSALFFICPGCASNTYGATGLHVLPVNTMNVSLSWDWNRDLEFPTLSPSILVGQGSSFICHSFLKKGIFQFLPDSTHSLSGEFAPIPDLPDWVINEE